MTTLGTAQAIMAVMLARQQGKTITLDGLRKALEPKDDAPPRQLSLLLHHKFYRPDYMRVGVWFNGVERNDVQTYDADAGWIETVRHQKLEGEVEVFWRYPATRQQRRALASWMGKR